jgi:hypothetical protein
LFSPGREPNSRSGAVTTVTLAIQVAAQIADYSLSAGRYWAGGAGTQIIHSASSRQSAPHAGVVLPHLLPPLGYEPDDGRLRRVG